MEQEFTQDLDDLLICYADLIRLEMDEVGSVVTDREKVVGKLKKMFITKWTTRRGFPP